MISKGNPGPLELARRYMDIFYGDAPLLLYDILDERLRFRGPMFQADSARDYIDALLAAPPDGLEYELLHEFETADTACLVYLMHKADRSIPMAQVFVTNNGRINSIELMFDSAGLV